jgi:site-specific DNA-adenine methylase
VRSDAYLRPFFTYFGGKHLNVARYPEPTRELLIEPFCGSAGYATRYHDRDVLLIDRNPFIVETWRYLISASPSDIMGLPLAWTEPSVRELDIPLGAQYLIGWWLNKGNVYPCLQPSSNMLNKKRPTSFWGKEIRARLASQVNAIKNWRVIEGSYEDVPGEHTATWFIDPPYQSSGDPYKYGPDLIDYASLAAWCRGRSGQVIVCENTEASWLPFRSLCTTISKSDRGALRRTEEAVWISPGLSVVPTDAQEPSDVNRAA